MSKFDTMQVCLKGHVITEFYEAEPHTRKNRCDQCGEATITQCPTCNTKIKGHEHSSAIILGMPTRPPKHCDNCGALFPWAMSKPSNTNVKLELVKKIQKEFTESDWMEISLITNTENIIGNHNRLLNSLNYQDKDYLKNIIEVINQIEKKDKENLSKIANFIAERYPESQDGELISSPRAGNRRKIIFAPIAFEVPEESINEKSVAVIFPFELTTTYSCIKEVCDSLGLQSIKANDLPNSDAFMQNIFKMIYTCRVAICDFTKDSKNANGNVLYETGIAHTLGKDIIAITQSMDDVPTDLKHINMIIYENTEDGYHKLKSDLKTRLENIFPNNLNLPF